MKALCDAIISNSFIYSLLLLICVIQRTKMKKTVTRRVTKKEKKKKERILRKELQKALRQPRLESCPTSHRCSILELTVTDV